MAGSKYETNITGGTIGAMSIGPGATTQGSVTVGAKTPTGARLRAKVDIRGARSRTDLAALLESAAKKVREGHDTGTIGSVSGNVPSGIAWVVEVDE